MTRTSPSGCGPSTSCMEWCVPLWGRFCHSLCSLAQPLSHKAPPQVSKKNLMEIVKKLMTHVDKAEGTTYRDELLTKIIDICSQSNYQHITNFEWYVPMHP